jgi:Domain of unknown function (DUF4111)/Nucleotidyltransferase domain
VSEQVDRVAAGLQDILGATLVGVYVHGSLVLGCFNPSRSDVDLLVVTRRRLTPDERARAFDLLRGEAGTYDTPGWPRPIELSSLALDDLQPWRYPTPYDLHFAESSRDDKGPGEDHDLAAHVWVTRRRGSPVVGPAPTNVFPDVPESDYRDSLIRDLAWARQTAADDPLYGVLSPVRIWAALEAGGVQTKESGALWALERLPSDLRPVVERALATYRGEHGDFAADVEHIHRLADFIEGRLRA